MMTRHHKMLGWMLAIGLLVSAMGAAVSTNSAGMIPTAPLSPAQFAAQATVLIEDDKGHGSGVVIGAGRVMTNAHVAGDNVTLQVTLATGVKKTGWVVWVGKGNNDLAMVEVATDDVKPAPINCSRAELGERVFTFGHPQGLRAVATWGRVASDVVITGADIAEARVLDLTVLGGNSGGGVWSEDGRLRGLAAALLTVPTGMMGRAPTGLSVMIPSTVMCRLLGRT